MAKTYVLSDVHIGNDTPTCWYQKSYHEPYLIAVLDEILKNKDKTDENKIDEVLLLGDLFDFWTYAPEDAPPSIEEILKANPNIFGEKVKFPDGTVAPGKLIQV